MARRKSKKKRGAASKVKEKEMTLLASQQGSCSVLELLKERFNSDPNDNPMEEGDEADEDFGTSIDTFDFDKTWDQISAQIDEEEDDDDITKFQSEILASNKEVQAELNYQVPEHEMTDWLKEDMEKLVFPPISRLKELVLEKLNKTEETEEGDSLEGCPDSEESEYESKKPRLDSTINSSESSSSAKLDNDKVIKSSQVITVDSDKNSNETDKKVIAGDDLPKIKIQLKRLQKGGPRARGKAKQNSETIGDPTPPDLDPNHGSLEKAPLSNETEKTTSDNVVPKVFSEGLQIETSSEDNPDKVSEPSKVQRAVEETKSVSKISEQIPTSSKHLEPPSVAPSNVPFAGKTSEEIKISPPGETTANTGSLGQGKKVTDNQTTTNPSTKILEKSSTPTSESIKDDIMTSITNELADMFGESMQEEEDFSVEDTNTNTLSISPGPLSLEQISPPSAEKSERPGVQSIPFTILSTRPGAIFEESSPRLERPGTSEQQSSSLAKAPERTVALKKDSASSSTKKGKSHKLSTPPSDCTVVRSVIQHSSKVKRLWTPDPVPYPLVDMHSKCWNKVTLGETTLKFPKKVSTLASSGSSSQPSKSLVPTGTQKGEKALPVSSTKSEEKSGTTTSQDKPSADLEPPSNPVTKKDDNSNSASTSHQSVKKFSTEQSRNESAKTLSTKRAPSTSDNTSNKSSSLSGPQISLASKPQPSIPLENPEIPKVLESKSQSVKTPQTSSKKIELSRKKSIEISNLSDSTSISSKSSDLPSQPLESGETANIKQSSTPSGTTSQKPSSSSAIVFFRDRLPKIVIKNICPASKTLAVSPTTPNLGEATTSAVEKMETTSSLSVSKGASKELASSSGPNIGERSQQGPVVLESSKIPNTELKTTKSANMPEESCNSRTCAPVETPIRAIPLPVPIVCATGEQRSAPLECSETPNIRQNSAKLTKETEKCCTPSSFTPEGTSNKPFPLLDPNTLECSDTHLSECSDTKSAKYSKDTPGIPTVTPSPDPNVAESTDKCSKPIESSGPSNIAQNSDKLAKEQEPVSPPPTCASKVTSSKLVSLKELSDNVTGHQCSVPLSGSGVSHSNKNSTKLTKEPEKPITPTTCSSEEALNKSVTSKDSKVDGCGLQGFVPFQGSVAPEVEKSSSKLVKRPEKMSTPPTCDSVQVPNKSTKSKDSKVDGCDNPCSAPLQSSGTPGIEKNCTKLTKAPEKSSILPTTNTKKESCGSTSSTDPKASRCSIQDSAPLARTCTSHVVKISIPKLLMKYGGSSLLNSGKPSKYPMSDSKIEGSRNKSSKPLEEPKTPNVGETSTRPVQTSEKPKRRPSTCSLESPPSAPRESSKPPQQPTNRLEKAPVSVKPVNDLPTSVSGENSKEVVSSSGSKSVQSSNQQSRPVERSGPDQRSTVIANSQKNTGHLTGAKRSNGFPSLSDPKKSDKPGPTFTPTPEKFPRTTKTDQTRSSNIVTLQCSLTTSTNGAVSISGQAKGIIKTKLTAETEVPSEHGRAMYRERTKHIFDIMRKPTSDKMSSNEYSPPDLFLAPIRQAVDNVGLEMAYPSPFRSPRLKSPTSPKPCMMGMPSPPRLIPRPSSYLPDSYISTPTRNGGPIIACAAKPPVVAPAYPTKSVIVPTPPLQRDTHNKFDALLECSICHEQFLCYDDNLFKLHLLIKHAVKIEEEKYFSQSRKVASALKECKKCGSYVLKTDEHQVNCTLSSIPFPMESSYELVNITDKKLNKHECGICSKSFSARYKLKTHIEGSHKHLLSKVILYPGFRCAQCLKGFETSVELTKHCRNCDQQCPTPETICELAKSYLHCDLCDEMHTHTRETTACYQNKDVLRCVLCFDVFKVKDEFYKHLRAYHGLQLIKGPLTLRCPFCPGEGKVNWGKYTDIFPHIIAEHLQPRIDAMNLISFSNSLV